jgi:hypothetical protein
VNADDIAVTAANLAERILDEVSSADQDWGTIASWARELAALADAAATPGGEGGPPGREGR